MDEAEGFSVKIYYEDEWATIYHGDCAEAMKEIPDNSVDLIVTDPPYGVAYETARRSRTDKLRAKVANDLSLDCFSEAWPAILSKLKQNRHWYAFASPRKMIEMASICEGYKHVLDWDKGDRGTVGDLKCGFGEAWEAIFYGMKGRRELKGSRPRTVIRHDWSSTLDLSHPTVKPVVCFVD